VIVPLLVLWLAYDERAATATSLAAIVFIAGFAAAVQGAYGNVHVLDAVLIGVPAVGGQAPADLGYVPADTPLAPRATAADQSNSGVVYGDKLMLKVFRVLEEGPSAEYEMAKFLSTRTPPFPYAPRLAGVLEYSQRGRDKATLGTLFEFVPNQGDAWHLAQDALD